MPPRKTIEGPSRGAWIGAGATVLVALIGFFNPAVQEIVKGWIHPTPRIVEEPPKKTRRFRQGLCKENPETKETYQFDINAFYPKGYTDLSKTFGGDAANPGHVFTYKTAAPGLVYKAVCRWEGNSEGLIYCGKDSDAKGADTKVAEIRGWINGEGGPTYMTVFYQMPRPVPDDRD
jgi:hypothetical protein